MFEPDGRNSLQTAGHFFAMGMKVFFGVLTVIILTPLAIFFWCSNTIGAQKAGVDLWNSASINAVRVDFNTPRLDPKALEAQAAWDAKEIWLTKDFKARQAAEVAAQRRADGDSYDLFVHTPASHTTVYRDTQKGWPPYLQAFPAGITTLDGEVADATYFWYNLPVGPGVITNLNVQAWGPRHPKGMGYSNDDLDPWETKGRWNLAPGKNWDSGSAELLLQAKATGNYAAYARATRIIGTMRAWVTAKHFGSTEGPSAFTGALVNPVKAGLHTVKPARFQEYAEAYNQTFPQMLPVVVLHLQTLDDDEVYYGFGVRRDFHGLTTRLGSGPFITGMTSGPMYNRSVGRPGWRNSDFWWSSTPYVSPGAAEAQEDLNAVSRLSFWVPLLRSEGLGSQENIAAVAAFLEADSAQHQAGILACKVDAHHFYNFTKSSLNPLREDLDSYNPHNR